MDSKIVRLAEQLTAELAKRGFEHLMTDFWYHLNVCGLGGVYKVSCGHQLMGWLSFEQVVKIAEGGQSRLSVDEIDDCLQARLDEYDRNVIMFGDLVTWTVEEVIDQYNWEMLTLESLGLLDYFYEPEVLDPFLTPNDLNQYRKETRDPYRGVT